jgi:hypothetical protein
MYERFISSSMLTGNLVVESVIFGDRVAARNSPHAARVLGYVATLVLIKIKGKVAEQRAARSEERN